jgi:hypothetical protein
MGATQSNGCTASLLAFALFAVLTGAATTSLLFMRQRVQHLLANTPVHSASAQAARMTDGRTGHVTFRSSQWSSLGGTLPV